MTEAETRYIEERCEREVDAFGYSFRESHA